MKKKFPNTLMTIIFVFLIGCQSSENTIKTTKTEENNIVINESQAYPISEVPQETNEKKPYPVITNENSQIQLSKGPEFVLFEPVYGGDILIEGTGPAGIPIILIDVTNMGTQLGETIINNEGEFRFELSNPVQSGHTIGLQLGDITNTDLNPQDFLYSPTYYDRPQIGVLFDIVHVK
jgi:hypothetical protein